MRPTRSWLCALLALASAAAPCSELEFSGFAHWDAAEVLGEAPDGLAESYRDWPRIRLAAGGALGDGDWKLEYDFAAEVVTDALVRVPLAGGRLLLGQFKQPLYMDALISDRAALMIEPAGNGPFAIGRRLGVSYQRSLDQGRWQAALYGRNFDDTGPDVALAGRAYRSIESRLGLWHLGAGLALERHDDARLRFRLRPESRSLLGHWADGGTLLADRVRRHGLELALQRGPWLLQSEWQGLRASGDASRSGRNAYLLGAWTLRGEPRTYRDGLFALAGASKGAIHTVEVLLRGTHTRLPRMVGGDISQSSFGAGLNLGIGAHARVQLNLSHARGEASDEAELIGLRVELGF